MGGEMGKGMVRWKEGGKMKGVIRWNGGSEKKKMI